MKYPGTMDGWRLSSTGRRWRLDVRREVIDVTSKAERPDPAWRFVDAAGHEHYYRDDPLHVWPTLTWVPVPAGWCEDCGEVHDDGEWQCPACGEVILPGMLPAPPWPEYVPGPIHATLVVEDRHGRRTWVLSGAEFAAYASLPPRWIVWPARTPDHHDSTEVG